MAIKVTWDSADQNIVRFDFEGKWNFLDFDYAVNESISLMKKVTHRVDWVMNLDAGGPLAAGAVLEARELREPLPEHHGNILFVGNPMFARGIATILNRVYPVLGEDFHFEENLTLGRLTLSRLLEPVA